MKISEIVLIACVALIFVIPKKGAAQELVPFEVNRVYPHLIRSKSELKKAKTIADLNWRYDPNWVQTYFSVEVSTLCKGSFCSASGKNAQLTEDQKNLIIGADAGAQITVEVHYLPENTLSQNEPKVLNFTVDVEPEHDAIFPGGTVALNAYLRANAISKISASSFEGYDLTAVKFIINEQGEVIDAHIFEAGYTSTQNEAINELLLNTIRTMPCWQPATYADGTKVQQEFVLTVGNMENCMVNLLNTRRDGRPSNG